MTLKPEFSGELRTMVRDVLREVMANRGAAPGRHAGAVEAVRIASDADLGVFIQRILQPSTLEAVRSGRLRFCLAGTAAASPGPDTALCGVITEQRIGQAAGDGILVLAADAVLTPLARDKARRLGLKIERRR